MATQQMVAGAGANSETFRSIAFDGEWLQFFDAKAATYCAAKNVTTIQWIDSYGDTLEGQFDLSNGKLTSKVLCDSKANSKICAAPKAKAKPVFSKKNRFYNASGKKIKQLDKSWIATPEFVAHNAIKKATAQIIIWDVMEDGAGNQSVAYTKLLNDTTQIYCYAKLNKNKWSHFELINVGASNNPAIKKSDLLSQNGGMSIDYESANTLYLSVNRDSVFEIEKWTQQAGKNTWLVEPITKASSKNNVRPMAVRGAKEGVGMQVVWQQLTHYQSEPPTAKLPLHDAFMSAIKASVASPVMTNALDSAQIVAKMVQAADWQLANPDKTKRIDWLWGAFYVGLYELYEITKDERYLNEMINVGQASQWTPLSDYFNPDRLIISDVWAFLYKIKKDPAYLASSIDALDVHLKRGFADINLTFDRTKSNEVFRWWTWCDGLYMAPQAFANIANITGEMKYYDYMNTHFWKSADYLYSKEDSLMYRDDSYFGKKTKNGQKVFWARGNGWVIGGLARLLDLMPADYAHRHRYETLYKEMMMKLISIQRPDGMWTVSLHDPEELIMGESSGTAFFTYALAWGINNGLVDAKYKANAVKAWEALSTRVNDQGQLGYVQKVAASPFPFYAHQWHVYATGTYFMAGKEMIKLLK